MHVPVTDSKATVAPDLDLLWFFPNKVYSSKIYSLLPMVDLNM